MKKAVFALVIITILLSGFGLAYVFKKYNRFENPNATRPQLVIYTHSSFMDVYGPGPQLKEAFEKECVCDLKFVDAGGGQMLLEKLKLSQSQRVDLVLGFDQLILKTALLSIEWRKIQVPEQNYHPIFKNNHYQYFIPYDWSPMTFITRSEGTPEPVSFKKFIEDAPEKSISISRPSISTPGQLLAFWVYAISGQSDEVFKANLSALKSKIKFQGPDWSASYGLFRKNQAAYGWSFLTSLLYHQEKSETMYKAIPFTEGSPVHLDYVGIPNTCLSCGLAQSFVDFLMRPEQQKLLVHKNYMQPVVQLDMPELQSLPEFNTYNFENMDAIVDQRAKIINLWEFIIQ